MDERAHEVQAERFADDRRPKADDTPYLQETFRRFSASNNGERAYNWEEVCL